MGFRRDAAFPGEQVGSHGHAELAESIGVCPDGHSWSVALWDPADWPTCPADGKHLQPED